MWNTHDAKTCKSTSIALCSYLSLQVVCVPEARCFRTVCPPVPPAVRLPSPLGLLQPRASAGRSVWVAVSVHRASTFTRDSV